MSGDNNQEPAIPVFCRDCAHVSVPASGMEDNYRCFAPQNFAGYNLVTGDKQYLHIKCVDARYKDESCGGEWFVQAPPKQPAAPITAQPKYSSMDMSVDAAQLASSQDAAKARLALLLAKSKQTKPAIKAGTNLLESL